MTLLKTMGSNSAAATVAHLLRSFANVTDILMVGIAAGVPRADAPDKHVRLGDVVVSVDGVVPYDNIKLRQRGRVEFRGSSAKPSSVMVGRVNSLRAKAIEGNRPWEQYLTRCAGLQDCTRPIPDTDKLYDWTDPPVELHHPLDTHRREGQPTIHFGRIASANILLKSPSVRDFLREHFDVMAIEMEGSGIADSAWMTGNGYLLVRGISDYADPGKRDLWQPYAAAAAAAYARALIESIPAASRSGRAEE